MQTNKKKTKLQRLMDESLEGAARGGGAGLAGGLAYGIHPILQGKLLGADEFPGGVALREANSKEKLTHLLRKSGKGAAIGALSGAGILGLMSLLQKE
jgi:hypothetical protein